ncbi:MAG: iron-sulfur cluster assembly scaffold protein [Candidatus Diapherotrites archaeon]|uniref:Iron-sulfur cluster assembly scaffold protein n=1 Tax=Candidatus Iainarchaeum sp. TaxID=3101447 RepID=A0A938YSK7_9ARCH|nr:iron-sulfur cluster assembly scaffold protein [Candidatus Diapherotrites archaeon]
MYSDKVLDEFRHPQNIGDIKNPDGVGKVGNPQCGDLMWVYIKVGKNKAGEEIIKDIKVKTFGCLPPNEKVVLGSEWANIDSIKEGQSVINGEGTKDFVNKFFEIPYNGKMLTFVPFVSRYNSFSVTREHPILGVKRENISGGKSLYGKSKWLRVDRSKIDSIKPEFIKAGELKTGDFLVFTSPKEKKDKTELSKDLLRLLGYYLAEGYPIAKGNAVAFAFHKDEKEFIEEVDQLVNKIINKKTSRRTRGNVTEIYFCSKKFSDVLLKYGGKGAKRKTLSEEIILLPPKKQMEVIKTFWAGDGDRTTRRKSDSPTYRLATASEKLAIQFQEILARNGIFSSISKRQRKEHQIERRNVTGSPLYIVKYKTGRKHNFVRPRKDYFLVPIKQIIQKNYDGFVYNLHMTNSPNSYLVKGFVVHNCVAAIATSSKLTEIVKGMTLEEALKIDKAKIAKELGGLPPIKMHCSILSMDGLRKAIEDYRSKSK